MVCGWVGSSVETKAEKTDVRSVGNSAGPMAERWVVQKAARWAVWKAEHLVVR